MTKHTIALTELIEKGADTDLLRQMLHFVVQQMMEFDVEILADAAVDCGAIRQGGALEGYGKNLRNAPSQLKDGYTKP